MKIVLILMVRNESKILERCLKAVENLVDAYCIHDTGSTDTTCEIAKEWLKIHEGCLTTSVWKDFGHNRTLSYQKAKTFVDIQGWTDTYGLLLDADMEFVNVNLKEQILTAPSYALIQCNSMLEYPNCRLIRMDTDCICNGVTHEYWNTTGEIMLKTVAYINDHNDGGCKSDKFTRDIALLERGLQEEPDNVRYMFYLAQTYHGVGRYKDAIKMYKKRIAAGGWFEEVWYSHYMIAQTYLTLENPIKFEYWIQKGYAFYPKRAEGLYKLVSYLRITSQHHKAYHYLNIGAALPLSTDGLFIETKVYNGLFDYERAILDYYVKPNTQDGLRSSMVYLMKQNDYRDNVLSNMKFYVKPLATRKKLTLPSIGGIEHPSAISLDTYPFANVRYVNYYIENGDFLTPNGIPVQTRNAYVNLETGELLQEMDDTTVHLPKKENHVRGLEDVRLYDGKFTATVYEYTNGVHIMQGDYNRHTGAFENCTILPSPDNRQVEKNWLPIPGTNNMIYDWFPFRVIGKNSVTYTTPLFFQIIRGSAIPVKRGNRWWVLTHFVEYVKPRNYYHCFVQLDENYKPCEVSLPFVFQSVSIEYCLSIRFYGDEVICYAGFMEKEPSACSIPLSSLQWIQV